jgi:hypothetical protein
LSAMDESLYRYREGIDPKLKTIGRASFRGSRVCAVRSQIIPKRKLS